MSNRLIYSLAFEGGESDRNQIDLYDAAHAMLGFHRSLALTTHLVLNNEIITQAPSLKGATIFATIPEPGSWRITATVVLAGLYHLGTAPKDTPLGHLVYSAYDYVVSESLGVHVDYDKSLGEIYESANRDKLKVPTLSQNRFDSLIEKCESPIRELHRPIVGEETANRGRILATIGSRKLLVGENLTKDTYLYMIDTVREEGAAQFWGRVASYNSNTFKGRVFVPEFGRPIPFDLEPTARTQRMLRRITESLSANTLHPKDEEIGYIRFIARRKTSKSGVLKGLDISKVLT